MGHGIFALKHKIRKTMRFILKIRRSQIVKAHTFSTFNKTSHSVTNVQVTKSNDTKSSHVLFISPTLLPEPSSSAAGVRTEALIRHFLASKTIFDGVHFACSDIQTNDQNSSTMDGLRKMGMGLHRIRSNRKEDIKNWFLRLDLNTQWNFNEVMKTKGALKAVIFDRFFSEEIYSFHFQKYSPNTLRILDMQDMHSLRQARKEILDDWDRLCNTQMMTKSLMKDLITCTPKNTNDMLIRELASIHRSDLIFVCSPHELHLLRDVYRIQEEKLLLAPFFTSNDKMKSDAQNKENPLFVFVGGFRHHPNVDAVLYLHNEIWPIIQSQLPQAEMHIYGAYPKYLINKLQKKQHKRFYIHGYAKHLDEVFQNATLLLCPLRYGAGIKGKIVDSWKYGVPVVTSPIGAEGMKDNDSDALWGGIIVEDTDCNAFASSVIDLYKNEELRKSCVDRGYALLDILYNKDKNLKMIDESIENAIQNLELRRAKDHVSTILWHQRNRSTEYFSKWIELKESMKTT